jgi:hypothetical protein
MGLFTKDRSPEFILFDGECKDFATVMVEDWEWFAAFAWKGYQAAGRGFVRLNKDGTLGYLAAAAPGLIASRGPNDRIIRDACARYRPDREIVISGTFARDEKAVRAGRSELFGGVMKPRFKDMLTPPEAHAKAEGDAFEEAAVRVLQQQREQERLALLDQQRVQERLDRMTPEERLYDQQRIEQLRRDYQLISELEKRSPPRH